MDLRSSKKGFTITVKDVEQANKLPLDHLFKQLRGSPIIDCEAIFDFDGMDTTIFSSPTNLFSLHLAAEVVRALDSIMMGPVQVGNNELLSF